MGPIGHEINYRETSISSEELLMHAAVDGLHNPLPVLEDRTIIRRFSVFRIFEKAYIRLACKLKRDLLAEANGATIDNIIGKWSQNFKQTEQDKQSIDQSSVKLGEMNRIEHVMDAVLDRLLEVTTERK